MLPRGKLKRLLHGHDVFGHADGRLAQDRHGALFPVHCATQPTLDGPSLRYMAIVDDVWCHVKPDGRYGRYRGLRRQNGARPRASPGNGADGAAAAADYTFRIFLRYWPV
jgi:hypothetical protein